VLCNLTNDLQDFLRGADTEERVGPQRVVQSGLFSVEVMRRVVWGLGGLIVCLGLVPVAVGGWPILAIGIASGVAAVAYTAGPYPLAYYGLGEPFVMVFFGPVPVWGTTLLITGQGDWNAAVAALGMSCVATAIMVVNNLRDREQDARVGKNTWVVRLGDRGGRAEYGALVGLAFLIPLGMYGAGLIYNRVWVILGAVPFAIKVVNRVCKRAPVAIDTELLGATVRLLSWYGFLLCFGWIL
jgi:1,4-dihydroxy-2-naphthoate octaprenyltransferase